MIYQLFMELLEIFVEQQLYDQKAYRNIIIQSKMARHQRANSDLADLKSIFNFKKASKRDLEEFGRVKRATTNYDSFSATVNKQLKCSKTLKSPIKKLQLTETISDCIQLLQHFYSEDATGYYGRSLKYLKEEWEGQKRTINQYLNKLPYLEQSMQKKTYPEIQVEIISQWRKSPVLYCLRAFWYQIMLKGSFKNLNEFLSQYNKFRDFIGQLAYLFFKGCFTVMENRGTDNIIDKLTDRTAHFIITSTNTWKKMYDRIINPLFISKFDPIPKSYRYLCKFNVLSLQMKEYVVNTQIAENQMPATTKKIKEFLFEQQFFKKISLLLQIRESLEQQIKQNQANLIRSTRLKKYQVLDKDDFISCLIYCVVKGNIDFEILGINVKYFQYFLAKEMSQILSKFGCDSYLTDLQAAAQYLHQWAVEQKTSNQLDITSPLTPSIKKTSNKSSRTKDTLRSPPLLNHKPSLQQSLQESLQQSLNYSKKNSIQVSNQQNFNSSNNLDNFQIQLINYNLPSRSASIIKIDQNIMTKSSNIYNIPNQQEHKMNSENNSKISNSQKNIYATGDGFQTTITAINNGKKMVHTKRLFE